MASRRRSSSNERNGGAGATKAAPFRGGGAGLRVAAVALQQRRFQRSERRPVAGPARPPQDITPLPDLLHARSRSGPVRTERPVYVDLLPPCNTACPAGENIQGYLAQVQAGQHERAWRILVADNPFAAIH